MVSKTSLKNLKDTMTNMYGGRLPLIDRLRFDIVEDDLEILQLFKELFDGENLEGWIEFDFGITELDEDSNHIDSEWIPKLKKIRSWLEKQIKENEK